jgi:hypothetical protein
MTRAAPARAEPLARRGRVAARAAASALAFVACSGPASADAVEPLPPLAPRETAVVRGPRAGSVGLFAPLRVTAAEGLEVTSDVAATAVLTPSLGLRARLGDARLEGGARLAGAFDLGLSTPTPTLMLARGFLTPSFETSGRSVPFVLVPSLGVVASVLGPGDAPAALTLRLDTALGLPFSDDPLGALDTVAPISLALAPATQGFRSRASLTWDQPLARFLRLRTSVGGALVGRDGPLSPLFFHTEAGLELRVTRLFRVAAGAVYHLYDQGRTAVVPRGDGTSRRVRVASHDVFPTLDLVWTWSEGRRR